MIDLLQVMILGAMLGGVYALMASGSLTRRTMRVSASRGTSSPSTSICGSA